MPGTPWSAVAWTRRCAPRLPMGGARAWFAHPGALRPRLPLVLGLRLFPRSVGADELALAQRLSADPAAPRAAFLLRTVHGLPLDAVHDLLESADAPDPAAALRSAGILEESSRRSPAPLLASQEFDDCALQAGPTDLLGRTRLLLAAAAIGLVTVVTLAVAGDGTARRIRARRTSPDGRPRPRDRGLQPVRSARRGRERPAVPERPLIRADRRQPRRHKRP
ncbi:hypothetical protein [Streptomyces hokutonensis]|uniref:hypothetical protein n=1 Tax=Streptomyces hokutonensis TaxID=1306990 RepID=UPI00380D74B6